jgi:twitching motility two-component system response regulator PilG
MVSMLYSPQTARLTQTLTQPEFEGQYPGEMIAAPSVMVIDDSMTVRAVVEASLTRAGFHVTAFPDGLAAMGALARGEVDVPSLLLLDIGLPKMEGYEVARILRSKPEFADTVFIMLTAHDGVLDKLRSKLAGASEFIAKPFNVKYVVEVVRRYLEAPSHHA